MWFLCVGMKLSCLSILFFLSAMITIPSILSEKKQPSSTKQLTRRRIISEFRDINRDNLTFNTPFNTTSIDECDIRLSPIENNFLQWHFSFRGVPNSSFAEGCYHGRIMLDKDYPRKAPSICVLTPNGRWEVGKDICLSASSYHQETWDMKWNLRTLVMALRGHMLTQPREIGSISSTPERHQFLAKLSRYYKCKHCSASHPMLLGDEVSFPADASYDSSIKDSLLKSYAKSQYSISSSSSSSSSTTLADNNNNNNNGNTLQSSSSSSLISTAAAGLTSKKIKKAIATQQSLKKQSSLKINNPKHKRNNNKNNNNEKDVNVIAPYHPLVKIFVLIIPILIHVVIQYFSTVSNQNSRSTQPLKKTSLFS